MIHININYAILFYIATIILQIFLSKKQNKWLGLIIPIIYVVFSVVFCLFILRNIAFVGQSEATIIGRILIIFLLTNIPTIILIAIYWGCKAKSKKQSQIEKMNIQDL